MSADLRAAVVHANTGPAHPTWTIVTPTLARCRTGEFAAYARPQGTVTGCWEWWVEASTRVIGTSTVATADDALAAAADLLRLLTAHQRATR